MGNLVMGIDPGKNGGIAIVGDDVFVLSLSNKTEMDIYEWIIDAPRPDKCFLEKVASMPGQGVKSMFSFGKSYGFLIGLLTATQIPFEFVRPLTWQKALSCQSKGDKNVTKSKAQQLFPKLKITHSIADSLLIAEYGRRNG